MYSQIMKLTLSFQCLLAKSSYHQPEKRVNIEMYKGNKKMITRSFLSCISIWKHYLEFPELNLDLEALPRVS
jgi:hypothetical protein